jgi:hypothetical protein
MSHAELSRREDEETDYFLQSLRVTLFEPEPKGRRSSLRGCLFLTD